VGGWVLFFWLQGLTFGICMCIDDFIIFCACGLLDWRLCEFFIDFLLWHEFVCGCVVNFDITTYLKNQRRMNSKLEGKITRL
jgi:hypothetical protein